MLKSKSLIFDKNLKNSVIFIFKMKFHNLKFIILNNFKRRDIHLKRICQFTSRLYPKEFFKAFKCKIRTKVHF